MFWFNVATLAAAIVPVETLEPFSDVKLAPLPANKVELTNATPLMFEPVPDIVMSALAAIVKPVKVPTEVILGCAAVLLYLLNPLCFDLT